MRFGPFFIGEWLMVHLMIFEILNQNINNKNTSKLSIHNCRYYIDKMDAQGELESFES
jgi:hypothetical protein